MIATAGGPIEYAKTEKIAVVRRENGKDQRLQVQLQERVARQVARAEHRAQARRHDHRSLGCAMGRLSISVLAGSAVLVSAVTAFAQESRPERPYRGVYASGTDQCAAGADRRTGRSAAATTRTPCWRAAETWFDAGQRRPARCGQGSVFNQLRGRTLVHAPVSRSCLPVPHCRRRRGNIRSSAVSTTTQPCGVDRVEPDSRQEHDESTGGLVGDVSVDASVQPLRRTWRTRSSVRLAAPSQDYGTGRSQLLHVSAHKPDSHSSCHADRR